MAPKTTNPLVRCESCGEDYSATYRRCPFCGSSKEARKETVKESDYEMEGSSVFDEGEKGNMRDSGYDASKGGKRLAGTAATGSGARSGSTSNRSQQSRGSGASGTKTTASRSASGSGTSRSRAPQPKSAAFWDFCDRIGISPVRVIGFLLTLALIIAAFLIVTKIVLPMIGRGSVDTPNNEKPDTSQTDDSGSSGSSRSPEWLP